VPIVGVDGWVDLVGREKRYKGMRFQEIIDEKSGAILGSTCFLKVEGLEWPVEVTEWMSECYRPTEPWKQMPRRMIRHKSLIQAARYAFGYSGIYDEDEARDIVEGKVPPIQEPMSLQEASDIIHNVADAQEAKEAVEAPPLDPEPVPQTANPPSKVSLEAPPAPPEPQKGADDASPMLVKQVMDLLKKHGLAYNMDVILSAMEARLLLSKRSKAEIQKVLENIDKAAKGLL